MSVERSALSVARSGSPVAVDRDNPWPGLSSFTEESRAFFFGRREETDELVRLIRRNTLTVLFGQSGLGKSSLLQAGAFPPLREADFLPLYLRLDHSITAAALADQVKAALVDACKSVGADAPAPRSDETLWEYFHRKDIDIWSAKNRLLTPILAFDQFEEIFTLGRASDAQRERGRAFLTELADLVENRAPAALREKFDSGELDIARYNFGKPSCQVVLSLREDFLPDLEGLKHEMRSIMHGRMRVRRLNGTQALEIIQKPAPHLLAEGVAERVVEFVAGARGGSSERLSEMVLEPALLSVICRELNERRRALAQDQITADLVSGNRREILSEFYDRSVADLPATTRAFVEDHLLTKSGFRDNFALETALEFPGVTRPLIDTLVSRRLLRIEDRLGVQRVELTHDVLAEVIRASRDSRQKRLAVAEVRRRTRNLRFLAGGLAAIVLALCAAGLHGLRLRRSEFQRISRTDARIGSRLLEEGRIADGLAFLVRAARTDPANHIVAPRIASVLTSRNFLLPEGTAVEHAAPVLWSAFSADGRNLGVLWKDGYHGRVELATGRMDAALLPSRPHSRRPLVRTHQFAVFECEDGVVRILDRAGQLRHEVRFAARLTELSNGDFPQPEASDLFVATLANQTLAVVDAATGQMLGAPIPAAKPVYLHLGPKWLLWSDAPDRTNAYLPTVARLRDTASGTNEITLRVPHGSFDWVTSPSGRHAAVVQRESSDTALFLRIWSLPEGVPVAPAVRLDNAQFGLAKTQPGATYYSPDGRHIVTWYSSLEFWDAPTGVRIARIPGAGSYSGAKLRFSPEGRLLATWSNIGSVDLWSLATGKPHVPALRHSGNVREAFFSDDGNVLLTSASDGFALVWETETGRLLAEPSLQQPNAPRAALSADGARVAIGTQGGSVYRLRVGRGVAGSLFLPTKQPAVTSQFLPGSPARLLWLERDRARVIEVASGRDIAGGFQFPEPIREIGNSFTSVRPDFKVMVVKTTSGAWQAWWIGDGRIDKVITFQEAPVAPNDDVFGYVAFSPSGDFVVVIAALVAGRQSDSRPGTGQMRAWDLRTGLPAGPPIAADPAPLFSYFPRFNHDGTRITLGSPPGQTVRIWDRASGRVVTELGPDSVAVRMSVFSPDGTRLATANREAEVRLWDVATGRQVGGPLLHGDNVYDAVFSPDGALLATHSSDGVLRFWHGASGVPVGETIENRRGSFRLVRFTSDGTRVVTANNDGTARVWDVATSLPLGEPMDHRGTRVPIAEFSFDGRFVLTELNAQAGFHIWTAPPTLPAGETTPEWLLELATICASKIVNSEGQFESAAGELAKIDAIRRTVAALSNDAPGAEWGKWFLADRATRSIAPGFTITREQADQLAAEIAARLKLTRP